MNSNNIDRRVALSTLLILFGVHFLLQAFPQTGYDFSTSCSRRFPRRDTILASSFPWRRL